MTPNTNGFFNFLAKRWLAVYDPAPSRERVVDAEALTNDELFRAIQYLDPEPEDLEVTEDEEIFLAIQDLDPDFN